MYLKVFRKILNLLHQLNNKNSLKDSMVIGLISGTVGALVTELLNVLLGNKLFFGKVASSMVVNPVRSFKLKNILLGEVMHMTVGAGIGALISGLLKAAGKDFTILKGIFISLLAWIGLHNGGHKLDLFGIKPHSTKSHYFALIQHLLYGLTTSVVLKYISDSNTFQQPSITKVNNRTSYSEYEQPFWLDPEKQEPNPQVLS